MDMMVTEDGDAMLGWIGGIGKQGGKQSKSRKIKGGHHETIPGARIMGHFGICPREQSEGPSRPPEIYALLSLEIIQVCRKFLESLDWLCLLH